MQVLQSSRLFSGLSPADFQLLEKSVRIQSYPAGKVIFTEGDNGDGLYMVQQGVVQISALIKADERRTLSKLGPGDFFGEMALLDNEPRSATATAAQDTSVYFIPRLEILGMLERSPKLAVNLMREFSLRLREFNHQYIQEVLQAERLSLAGRFARSIVHDLKNPLNVIGIAADLAAMETATPTLRQTACSRIRKQIDRLTSMINELLEFTRGAQTPVVLSPINYGNYVQQLVEDIRSEIVDDSITITFANEPPQVRLLLDPNRMIHVFSNLIHNAIDAMPNGGRITLRFITNGKEVVTEIQDSGPGIATEIAPRLFEAFASYGKLQGTGLGLSICKRVIEDHQGRIEARNAPAGGAILSFALPTSRG